MKFVLLTLFFTLSVTALFSEVFTLKDGRIINGTIIKMTEEMYYVLTPEKEEVAFERTDVMKTYKDYAEYEAEVKKIEEVKQKEANLDKTLADEKSKMETEKEEFKEKLTKEMDNSAKIRAGIIFSTIGGLMFVSGLPILLTDLLYVDTLVSDAYNYGANTEKDYTKYTDLYTTFVSLFGVSVGLLTVGAVLLPVGIVFLTQIKKVADPDNRVSFAVRADKNLELSMTVKLDL